MSLVSRSPVKTSFKLLILSWSCFFYSSIYRSMPYFFTSTPSMFRSSSIILLSMSSISFYLSWMVPSFNRSISAWFLFFSISSFNLVSKSCRALFILCNLSTVSSYYYWRFKIYSFCFSEWIVKVLFFSFNSSFSILVEVTSYLKLSIFWSVSSLFYTWLIMLRLLALSSVLASVICLSRSSHLSS